MRLIKTARWPRPAPRPPFIEAVLADPWFCLSGPRSLDWAQFTGYLQDPGFTTLPIEDKLVNLAVVTAQSLSVAYPACRSH